MPATYPDLPTAYGSDPQPLTKNPIDRAEDNTGRGRILGADKVGFEIVHPRLSVADKATLDAFYNANRQLEFYYVCKTDGLTYTCIFSGRPEEERRPGSFWKTTVKMEQV